MGVSKTKTKTTNIHNNKDIQHKLRGPCSYISDQTKRNNVNFGIFEDPTFIFDIESYLYKTQEGQSR